MAIKSFSQRSVLEERKNNIQKEFIAKRATDVELISNIIPAKILNQSLWCGNQRFQTNLNGVGNICQTAILLNIYLDLF